MKYDVNEECIGCGMCNGICPEVFEMTEEGVAKAIESDVLPEYEESAQEAKDGCPVSAIEEKI